MLSPEELEAALALLSTEADVTAVYRRSLWTELLQNVLVGALLFGLPLGLITVAFSWPWGVSLIAVGGVAFGLLMVAPESEVQDEVKRFRTTLEGTEYYKAAEAVWLKRQTGIAGLIVLLLAPVLVLVGAAWLVYGLVVNRDVEPLAILVIALPSLAFWVWIAVDNLRELRYFSSVTIVRDRFEEQLKVVEDDSADTAVSQTELDVLEKVEMLQTQRTVKEAVEQLPSVTKQTYAVVVAPDALHELEQLAAESPSEWMSVHSTILSLQDDPRPPSAKPASGSTKAFQVAGDTGGVAYVVDDEKQSVHVVSIESEEADKPPNASA